jgi:tetratricopeptide (TPR) repeat protein
MKSLEKNRESKAAQFNLGDALYKQEKYEDALRQFEGAASNKNLSKTAQANAYHNLGNSYLKAQKFPESVDAFKNALKLNPKDNDTRYNLAYAQAMLQKQKQQQQQQNQNKDQQKQDQQQQQEKKEQQKQEQEQKQAQQQKQEISKQDAEKILQALNDDEKNTQKKLIKKEATRIRVEKQW